LVMSNVNDYSHQWIWNKNVCVNPFLTSKMPIKNFEDILVFYQQYDDMFSDWRRSYFKNVLEFTGVSKKRIIEKLGQGLDHCFRYGSRQFDVPTEDNYIKLEKEYDLKNMLTYKPYNKISDIKRTYNPQMEIRGNPTKKGFRGTTKADSYLGVTKMDTLKTNNKYFPTAIIKIQQKKSKQHPTQKPVALFQYLQLTYTNEGDTILDNCAGSFTTAVAADNIRRNWICIEKDPDYCAIGKKRINENRMRLNSNLLEKFDLPLLD